MFESSRTKITHSNFSLELCATTGNVLPRFNGLLHASVDSLPVGSSEHCAGTKESKWIVLSTCIIHCNIPEHVLVDLLGKIDIDAEEVSLKKIVSKSYSDHCCKNDSRSPWAASTS